MSDGLNRYIATVETSKHRVFVFLSGEILPDNMLIAIATRTTPTTSEFSRAASTSLGRWRQVAAWIRK